MRGRIAPRAKKGSRFRGKKPGIPRPAPRSPGRGFGPALVFLSVQKPREENGRRDGCQRAACRRGEPHAVHAQQGDEDGEREQREEERAADGDAEGGPRPVDGGKEGAEPHADPAGQVGEGEELHGPQAHFQQGRVVLPDKQGDDPLPAEAHPCQRDPGEQRAREQHPLFKGEHAAAQLRTVAVADRRLHRVGHAIEEGGHDAVHVEDDGKRGHRHRARQMKQDAVQDDHQDGARDVGKELGGTVEQNVGDLTEADFPAYEAQLELFPEKRPVAEEGAQREPDAGGQRGGADAEPQHAKEQVVQQNIEQGSHDVERHAVVGAAADAKVVIDREEHHDEGREDGVHLDIFHRERGDLRVRPHQAHKRFRAEIADHSHDRGYPDDQQGTDGKNPAGLQLLFFAQVDGDLYRRTDGDHIGEGEADAEHRHDEVDCREGVRPDETAHKDAVGDRIEGGDGHADHAGEGAPKEQARGGERLEDLILLFHIKNPSYIPR